MRTAALLVLVTAFLSVGTGGIRHSNRMSFGGFMSSANANIGTAWVGPTSGDNDAAELLQPFQQKDTEYSFIYNAQIASGLQSAEQSTANPQQKEVTRIQCLANIHFASGWHAQLRLEQCRVGQQNGKMSQPQEVQTMEAFEETNIAEQIRQQLLTPCQFSFADGVIERVQCPQDTEEWSKNAKKAVLNIIQLNLKQNNAQGLHKSSASHAEQFQQEATGQGKSFKIHEITVEGACQTMYTINKAQRIGHQQQQQQFNVTKTFNFKKCQKIADVANGFQADQPQCAQCQQYWAQQQNDQSSPTDQQQKTNAWQMGESDQHPCAKCDPKEVKENEMDRSTVIRCRIAGDPADQYALRGCELRSQYIYRSWKSAEAGTNGAVMQTVVVANLEAVAVKPKNQQIPAINGASEHDTLMYSNDKAVDEKRFFANGDNEFGTDGKGSPFARVPKVQQAKQALLKLEQYTENNHKGIDQQAPVQQQRLVEMLRMCTEKELKQVEEHCANAAQQQKQKRGEKCHQMMANALAQCGTRNCVAELARKIKNEQLVQSIAVQSLLALNQLPSPSDATFDDVQQLCQSETVAGRNNSFFRLVPSLLIGVSALFAIVIYLIHNPLISSDDRPQDIDENNPNNNEAFRAIIEEVEDLAEDANMRADQAEEQIEEDRKTIEAQQNELALAFLCSDFAQNFWKIEHKISVQDKKEFINKHEEVTTWLKENVGAPADQVSQKKHEFEKMWQTIIDRADNDYVAATGCVAGTSSQTKKDEKENAETSQRASKERKRENDEKEE